MAFLLFLLLCYFSAVSLAEARTAATRTFADYAQALGDAMKHGYLSDVKTLP